jgi:hypothetical protein
VSQEQELIDLMAECSKDPLKFVLAAFPWGEEGGELASKDGPREWQRKVLEEIRDRIADGQAITESVRIAVASGHGIGKSALVSWLVLWAMATRENTRGVVTANTANQLATKTWPEVAKWFRMLICEHWFDMTTIAISAKEPTHAKTWRIDAVTWSKENLEAFAGLHNEGNRLLLIFDEASNIANEVWEVAEGALTDADTEIFWVCFGNPTRNTGRFRECFRRYKHRWWTRNVDSRTVDGTNKRQMEKWSEDYGEESDFMKVRVRGQFPEADSNQFISSAIVRTAMEREAAPTLRDPIIIGVDVARSLGGDSSVAVIRRGNDARTIPSVSWRIRDLMELADHVASLIYKYDPDLVVVDETGVGGGLVDRLRQMGFPVRGVNFANSAPSTIEGIECANIRMYMWYKMMDWLRLCGAIPDSTELFEELTAPEVLLNKKNQMLLEAKDDIKAKIGRSTDVTDALALTFVEYVGERRERGAKPSITKDHSSSEFFE